VRWIVFDYGEVISTKTAALPALAGLMGVPEDDFTAAYWAVRDPYDRGQPDLDYWRAVGVEVGVDVGEELSERLTEIDVAGWLHPDPATLELLAELDRTRIPLALLSNAPSSFARTAERQEWTRHFRHLVFSGDLGIAKPDERIWAELANRLDARPADCVFLDDRQANIDGAKAAGMSAMLWTSPALARTDLVDLGLLA
jgi:putative hydrolase of the HAD superfamily